MMKAEARGGDNVFKWVGGIPKRLLVLVLPVMVLSAAAVVGDSACAEEPAESARADALMMMPVENVPTPVPDEAVPVDDAVQGQRPIEKGPVASVEASEPAASPPYADVDGFVIPLKLEDVAGRIHDVPAPEEAKKLTVLAFLLTADPATKRIRKKLPGLKRQPDEPEAEGVRVLVLVPTLDPQVAPAVRAWKLPLPVCIDAEGRLADYLLIRRVPSFVIVDATGVVRFHGSFAGLANALAELGQGVKVSKKRTPVFGCVLADRLRGEQKLIALTGGIALEAPAAHTKSTHSASKEKLH